MKSFTIGRYPENNFVFSHPMVSGRHADITIDDNGVIRYADHSSNGSYINGQFINHEERIVTAYDVIKLPDGTVFDWQLVFPVTRQNPAGADPFNAATVNMPKAEPYRPVSYPEKPSEVSSRHVELNFSEAFSYAFSNGFRHTFRVLAVFLLWLITIWIPYLNIGTTIGFALLPAKMAADDSFSPFYIFDPEYRKNMGLYLLTSGFMFTGIIAATAFMVFPGLVLAYSWMLSPYFLIEKKKNPIEALVASNNATYGSKWTMLFVQLLLWLIFAAVGGLLSGLMALMYSGVDSFDGIGVVAVVGIVVVLLFSCCAASINVAAMASFWKQLKDNA